MRTCIRLCRKRRSQLDVQGVRRGPRNGRAGWIDYRPKCHVGRYVDGGQGGCCWLAIGRGVARGEARQTTQGTWRAHTSGNVTTRHIAGRRD